jgi:hypothetical protein
MPPAETVLAGRLLAIGLLYRSAAKLGIVNYMEHGVLQPLSSRVGQSPTRS